MQRLILAHIYVIKVLPVKKTKTKSFYVTCRSQKQCSRRFECFNMMCGVLSFPHANVFLSRNLTCDEISHKQIVSTDFVEIGLNSVETICLQNISRKVEGKAFIPQGAIYIVTIFWKYYQNFGSNYN